MIDIYELYQKFLSRVNSAVSGWWRPQADFENQCNIVSNEFWEKYTKQAEKSQEITDNLRYFLVSKNMIVKPANSNYGTFSIPDKYARFSSARMIVAGENCIPCAEVDEGKCANGTLKTEQEITEDYYKTISEINVEKIQDQKWAAVLQHRTKKPAFKSPKITQIGDGFKVAPREVSVIVLDYYIKPDPCKFIYTISPGNPITGLGDELIYNKNQSKPLPWPETMIGQFVDRLEEIYTQFTRDQVLAQLSTQNNP